MKDYRILERSSVCTEEFALRGDNLRGVSKVEIEFRKAGQAEGKETVRSRSDDKRASQSLNKARWIR